MSLLQRAESGLAYVVDVRYEASPRPNRLPASASCSYVMSVGTRKASLAGREFDRLVVEEIAVLDAAGARAQSPVDAARVVGVHGDVAIVAVGAAASSSRPCETR